MLRLAADVARFKDGDFGPNIQVVPHGADHADFHLLVDSTTPPCPPERTLYLQTLEHWHTTPQPPGDAFMEVWTKEHRRVAFWTATAAAGSDRPKIGEEGPRGALDVAQDWACCCAVQAPAATIHPWAKRFCYLFGGQQQVPGIIHYRIVFHVNDAARAILQHELPILIESGKAGWHAHDPAIERLDADEISVGDAIAKIKLLIDQRQWDRRQQAIQELRERLVGEESVTHTVRNILETRVKHETYLSEQLSLRCVNLDRCPERWTIVQREFARHGLKATRFAAVDGHKMSLQEMADKKIVQLPHMEPAPGVVGCLASHATLWREIGATSSGNGWVLICEDDVQFHPDFVHLFASYWEQVQACAEAPDIVFFGCTSPNINGPLTEATLLDYGRPLWETAHVVQTHHPVQGSFAYAVTPAGAAKLASIYLPCNRAVDYFPADRLRIFVCRRPAAPRNLICYSGMHETWSPWCSPLFYTIFGIWKGRYFIHLHGLISVRETPSTVHHHYAQVATWYTDFLRLKNNGFWEQALQLLHNMERAPGAMTREQRQFTYWDELIICCYFTGRVVEARSAARRLLSLNQYSVEGRKHLQKHGDRLVCNIGHLSDSELTEEYRLALMYVALG